MTVEQRSGRDRLVAEHLERSGIPGAFRGALGELLALSHAELADDAVARAAAAADGIDRGILGKFAESRCEGCAGIDSRPRISRG